MSAMSVRARRLYSKERVIFSAWLERLQISCVTMPTPLFAEWTRSDRPLPRTLRMFYAGGEAMPAEAAMPADETSGGSEFPEPGAAPGPAGHVGQRLGRGHAGQGRQEGG